MQIIRNLFIITIAALVMVFSWSSSVFSAGTVTVTMSGDRETIRLIGDDMDNDIIITTESGDCALYETDPQNFFVLCPHCTEEFGKPV